MYYSLLLLLSVQECVGFGPLALGTPKSTPLPIQKVAIVGSGIAGLSLAHALENSPMLSGLAKSGIQVTLLESRPSLDFKTGAGIQLNGDSSLGLAALRQINPEVQKAVMRAGLPLSKIQSSTKPWFNNGKLSEPILEFAIPDLIRNTGGTTTEELFVDNDVLWYTIMRGTLQDVLFNTLPASTRKRAMFNKVVTGIKASSSGGVVLNCRDGSSEEFDLVIGCDGVKSAVKEYVDTGKISQKTSDRNGAIYSGIRIRYAVQDGLQSDSLLQDAQLLQFFGDGVYSLYGEYGAGESKPPTKCVYTIFQDQDYIGPFKKNDIGLNSKVAENVDWSQDVTANIGEDVINQLDESGIQGLELKPVVSNANRFFELGVYFHNPFSFTGWSREVPGSQGRFCALCGDSAHAMPPFLGQGANQAMQDAYCLAKKIFEHNAAIEQAESDTSQDKNSGALNLKGLLNEYEKVRWPATTSISAKASLVGYLETGSAGFFSKFRDILLFVLGKTGAANKVLLGAATPRWDD